MLRKILLVDSSEIMRRILRGMLLANVDDAQVIEAGDALTAKDKMNQEEIHIILYSWETSDQDSLNAFPDQQKNDSPPLLLLVSRNQEQHIKKNQKNSIEYLVIPCSAEKLARRINRLCNPVTLRSNKRYSLKDSSIIIQQKSEQFPGILINISFSGLLCVFDFNEAYNWTQPLNIQAKISLDDKIITIDGLYSRLVRLQVIETNPDFTPKKIKTAFEFIQQPSRENKNLLREVFNWSENREKLLKIESG